MSASEEKKKATPLKPNIKVNIALIVIVVIVIMAVAFYLFFTRTQYGQRLSLKYFDGLRKLSLTNPFSKTGMVVSSVQNMSKANPSFLTRKQWALT